MCKGDLEMVKDVPRWVKMCTEMGKVAPGAPVGKSGCPGDDPGLARDGKELGKRWAKRWEMSIDIF